MKVSQGPTQAGAYEPFGPMGPVLFLARSLGPLLLHLMAGILGHHGIIGPYTCRGWVG